MSEQRKIMLAILWGIVASIFLSSTFVINSLLSASGDNWAWTAALRSLFLIPVLAIVLLFRGQLQSTLTVLRQCPLLFLKWGILGFGLLYTTLSLASLWSPGWMVAASFQVNILAGILLAPFIYPDHRRVVPRKALIISLLILCGVFIMQFEKLTQLHSLGNAVLSFLFVLIGAVVWPLGNRRLMVELEYKGLELNALQRVWGMTVGCFPLLLVLSIIGYTSTGFPSLVQCEASFCSAIFSGFLGGVGFYKATQLVNKNAVALAAIEATQVLEILFTLIGEILLNGVKFPGFYAQIGFAVIVMGLIMHFWNTWNHSKSKSAPKRVAY